MRESWVRDMAESDDRPIMLYSKEGPLGRLRDVQLNVGDVIRFGTRFIEARGTILSINHAARYPIKVEWYAADNKRISDFSPSEFITVIKES